MAIKILEVLKGYFYEHAYPTWQQFHDLLDSFRHKSEKIPLADVDGLTNQLNGKASTSVTDSLLENFENYRSKNTDIEISEVNGLEEALAGGTQNPANRGSYTSFANLVSAISAGNPGDEAIVDEGVGFKPKKYIWDSSDNIWSLGSSDAITTDSSVTANSLNPVQSGAVYTALAAVKQRITVYKPSANGAFFPPLYPADTVARTISAVRLSSNCASISFTVNGTLYSYTATNNALSIPVAIGQEITINSLEIKAGFSNSNAIIIF